MSYQKGGLNMSKIFDSKSEGCFVIPFDLEQELVKEKECLCIKKYL